MPFIKKQSKEVKRLEDRERKRLQRNVNAQSFQIKNADAKPADTIHTTTASSSQIDTIDVQHPIDPINTNAASGSQMDVCASGGIHEHSFTGLNVDSVLHGEIDIQIMDYAAKLMHLKHQCRFGMLPPSYLHYLVTSGQDIPMKVPNSAAAVQMHYCGGHYVLSALKHGIVTVYDSLPSQQHLTEVTKQLAALYEGFDPKQVKYTTTQHQGFTSLCGLFVVANAAFILNDIDPKLHTIVKSEMRTHFHRCLINSEILVFPTAVYSEMLCSYFADQKSRDESKQSFQEVDVICKTKTVLDKSMAKAKKRQDESYRQAENTKRNLSRVTKRQNKEYRSDENSKRNVARTSKRQSDDYKENENVKRNVTRTTKRQSDDYKKNENLKTNVTRTTKRQSDDYRKDENSKRKVTRTTKRQSDDYRKDENLKTNATRTTKRQSDDYRKDENSNRKVTRTIKRQSDDYRKDENSKRKVTRTIKRQSDDYRKDENLKTNVTRTTKRQSDDYRKDENSNRKVTRTIKRQSDDYRKDENLKTNVTRTTKRQSDDYRKDENSNRKVTRTIKRQSDDYRKDENSKRNVTRTTKRQSDDYRKDENSKRKVTRTTKRQSDDYRKDENSKRKVTRTTKHQSDDYRKNENSKRNVTRTSKRQSDDYRKAENSNRKVTRTKKRKHDHYRNTENKTKREKRLEATSDLDTIIKKFHATVSFGPIHVCHLCQQLWYRHSVCKAKSSFKGKSVTEMIKDVLMDIGKDVQVSDTRNKEISGDSWICTTCLSYLRKRKAPPCSYLNKMTFYEQGPLKDLNILEQLLIAPVLPFFRLHQAAVGKQFRINGNIVLVPSDVRDTVTSLPRIISDTGTIKATLKRRLKYKHHLYSMTVRPEKLRQCLKFLKTASNLYQEFGVGLNDEFDEHTVIPNGNDESQIEDDILLENNNVMRNDPSTDSSIYMSEKATVDDDHHGTNCSADTVNKQTDGRSEQPPEKDDDEWSECDKSDEPLDSPGIQDTMLSSPDFIEPSEKDFIYNFAPGEGRTPVSVFLQPHAEELAFPSIYCGKARPTNTNRITPVSYSEIVKSELRNQDRRAALNIENLFFKTKKLQMKRLIDQTQVAIRKSKTKGQHVTAKDVRGDSANEFIHQDKAFRFMASIRGSPSYFQTVSKDLFAMIRQLGHATYFCSLSAAETRWMHLLKILSEIVDHKPCTEEDAQNFDWPTKCRLIQSDPITCARHFDYSVNKFIREFLQDNSNPIGHIKDYFYRVEYQQRGSPHVHMLIWCDDAPVYGENTITDVVKFIDSKITCAPSPETDTALESLVLLQTHRHSHTCRKKSRKECRFGFPKPPMKETCILQPLTSDQCDKSKYATYRENWKKIQQKLNEIYELNEEITFTDFLHSLSLTTDEYVCAVRTSIKTATVFLKRDPSEARINGYNPHMLKAWRANIDLQYVLDVYACASYIAAYVTKSHRGMSELLRNAADEAQKGNLDMRKQVRVIGNKFLNAVEISAQEAVYICLGLPMRKSSRRVIFINTSPPDERVFLLKPSHELEQLDGDSDEIECSNVLKRYSTRPKSMETVTLANFISNYTTSSNYKQKQKTPTKLPNENLLVDHTLSDNDDDMPENENEDSKMYQKLKTTKILRYVHFNPDTDKEKFCREQLMLFQPWRDEGIDLLAGCLSYEQQYNLVKEDIETERLLYEPFRKEVDEAEKLINSDTDFQDIWDTVAPVTEHIDGLPDQTLPQTGNREEEYDIGPDLGLPSSTNQLEEIHKTYEMPDNEYRVHMRSLNQEQMKFVTDTIHNLKTSEKPIYRFLSGGAGCGKTHVLKAIYQTAVKYYNSLPGKDFTTSPVLLMAPTGKAAYHIRGRTIHNAMKIPANQRLEYKPLSSSNLNTFRNQLCDVKLIIIDEISMVGFRMFNFIHQRLQELKQSSKDFGGVSIIVIGDLFQLKPVHDSYIFQQPRASYMTLATSLWHTHFQMYELLQIMRQRDSRQFALLLNRLREGQHTDDDLKVLSNRIVHSQDSNYPKEAPHLFTTNAKVDSHNINVLCSGDQPVHSIKAVDRLVGNCSAKLKQKILDSFEMKHNDQLPNIVSLREGCVYDLTVNLDTADGLTNGATCTVRKINRTHNKPSGPVWLQFQDETAGQTLRTGPIMKNINKSWTPLYPISRQFSAGYKGEAQIQRLQYPLRPAAAKTIHRAQGDTIQTVVVDLTTSRKVDHVHYVALSRATTLEGLYILNLQQDKISINAKVQEEVKRLRHDEPVLLSPSLFESPSENRICFLNARSLHRHLLDVKQDFTLQLCSIICCCETRLRQTDTEQVTQLVGFHQYRQDAPQSSHRRPAHGMVLYSKTPVSPVNLSQNNVEVMLVEIDNCKLVFVYRPPSTSVSHLLKTLLTIQNQNLCGCNSLLIGDFNVDFNKQSADQSSLQRFASEHSYRQHVKVPTTDHQSMIDLIFTNFKTDVQYGVHELYFSDHKAIWMVF